MDRDPFERLRAANPVTPDLLPPAPLNLASKIVSPRNPSWRRGLAISAAAAVLVIVGGGAWALFSRGPAELVTGVGAGSSTIGTEPAGLGELRRPERDLSGCAAETVRDLGSFESALSTGDRSFETLCSRVGPPDWETGSGLMIFVYDLLDGSQVWLGYGGPADLVYAKHVAVGGRETDLALGAPETDLPEASAPSDGPCSASGGSPLVPQDGLPYPVAATREALWQAATTCDWEALRRLGGSGVRFSFGPETDAIVYWQSLEAGGGRPLFYLVELLNRPFATVAADDLIYYAWPSAFTYPSWSAVPEVDREALRPVFGDADFAEFAGFGGYSGYRVGILADGTWSYFVAGD
jgi:hypothetical protein